MDFDQAEQYAKDEAERIAETHVQDGIDENLAGDEGDEESEAEWNWEALAKMAHTRWGIDVKDRDLKRLGRGNVAEYLIERAREAIRNVDLSEGRAVPGGRFSAEDGHCLGSRPVRPGYQARRDQGARCGGTAGNLSSRKVIAAYDEREAEYPVMAGLYRFVVGQGSVGPARS